MGKGKGRKVRSKAPSRAPAIESVGVAGEDRRSLAVTVAWTTSSLATLASLVLAGLAWILRSIFQPPAGEADALSFLPELLLFTSAATGCFSLVFTPMVYRFRTVQPPRAVTVVVFLIAVIPWVMVLVSRIC